MALASEDRAELRKLFRELTGEATRAADAVEEAVKLLREKGQGS